MLERLSRRVDMLCASAVERLAFMKDYTPFMLLCYVEGVKSAVRGARRRESARAI